MIETVYKQLLKQNGVGLSSAEKLWSELKNLYSGKKRHYHNLYHLSDLYREIQSVKPKINNWNIMLFTLFYHDAIYNPIKKNNEEASAKLAKVRMKEIGIKEYEIKLCVDQITATKSHDKSSDPDTNFFNDADLSILGRDWITYDKYCKNIRKEYSIYPNFLYKKGRKKVIDHFLSMDRIFKTEEFNVKYEDQARLNLTKELKML